MKLYCTVCAKQQSVLIDSCVDARTNEPYQDIVCEECGLVIASGTDIAEQAEQEPVTSPDKGLWEVQQSENGKVYLLSDDFEHDVSLLVNGDFAGDKADYATRLAAWMNYHLQTPAPARTKDLTDDEIDAIEIITDRQFARAVIAADRKKNK